MEQQKVNPWKAFIPMLFGLLMIMIVVGMNTPAYPYISADLGISSVYISWMTAFYSLAACVLAPLMGRFGDTLGIKKVLLFGMAAFAAGCVIMAVSPNFTVMLVGRFVQGIGVSCVLPSAMAFVGKFFPAEKLGTAYAVYGGTLTAGPVIGPLVAGVMVAGAGWRVMFLAGAAATVAGLVAVLLALPKIPVSVQEKKRFDSIGTASMFIAVGSLLLTPTLAGIQGWTSPLVIILIILFLVFLAVFLFNERKFEAPLINLKLVKSRGFFAPTLLNFIVGGVLQASLYMMSYYLVAGLGRPSTLSGTWTSVTFLSSTIISMTICGIIIKKLGTKKAAFIPVILLAGSTLIFSTATADVSTLALILGGILMGAATGISSPVTMAASMAQVDPKEQGSASGTYRMIGDLGGPVGVQIFVPLLSTLALTAEGAPDFAASFPMVNRLVFIAVGAAFVMAVLFPKDKQKSS